MPFEVPELLGPYLLPLLIAVPLAIVVLVISRRRGDDLDNTRAAPSTMLPPTQPMTLAEQGQPASLLLVDDSAVARAKLGKLFESAGYRVTLAKDGVDALEQLAQQHFNVMVTDLEMPNKDGFELIADVQGSLETEDLPIIAITGHDELHTRVHDVQGIYGLFKKPWNDRELLKRVEALVSMRKPRKA
ncbi:response regulator [Paucibacter sp. O1-1]|uniref:response regulator n=1 Tax=unclassified Roseateles TaxID=2626991 RepID=UPI0014851371|nr:MULTISPECIES: response regulator [unclassified Roseateles]MCU7374384.1 response regulator [Paucibacter sp. O1-1]MCZ7882411.1 response regulator [Paucibacter sp. M5-1]MDA3829386.1 response regulator [Paucibacter sp. O1-1]MDC6166881.1 response regulator [Paucibacter sp. XJ19-41]